MRSQPESVKAGRSLPILSNLEQTIMALLRERSEAFALDLVGEHSTIRIKRGSVYVTLYRMVDKGYLASRAEESQPGAIGLPRRFYKLTPYGVKVLAWNEHLDEAVEAVEAIDKGEYDENLDA